MKPFWLLLVGVVAGWAASGVDWSREAVGEAYTPPNKETPDHSDMLWVTPVTKPIEPIGNETSVGKWSEVSGGIQARLSLAETDRVNGTRMLVPYLELRNASDLANPIKLRCGSENVTFELLDKKGKPSSCKRATERSGAYSDPGTVSLPIDSYMRFTMRCTSYGVPKVAVAAMIATDSGAWYLNEQDLGSQLLRVSISGKKTDDQSTWMGTIVVPPVPVTWQ
ncbi:hypothetical protein [Lacipirellula sp.]|uniref:hypothetical protein n=1 Tax=Lacipirellula sp. TaxID=2691419 RepID=UPI003D0EB87E